MPTVTLFSQPNCPPCKATKRALNKLDINYITRDLVEDPSAADEVKRLGYSSTPVVFVNEDLHWSGFRPSEIERIAKLSD